MCIVSILSIGFILDILSSLNAHDKPMSWRLLQSHILTDICIVSLCCIYVSYYFVGIFLLLAPLLEYDLPMTEPQFYLSLNPKC